MRSKRGLLSVVGLTLATVLLAACATQPGGGTSQKSATFGLTPLNPPVNIWIAEDGSTSGGGFYVAHAKGYFKELGINATIKPFESSADMLPAIASGEIDVAGGISSASLFNAVVRGVDIRIIGDKGTNFTGASYYNLVVRKDLADQIKDYKDLKGRKIGVFSLDSINEYTVSKALAKGGLTTADVQLVPMGPPDMNVALANRSIEVGMQIETLITAAEKNGIAVRFKDTTDFLPGAQIAVVLASPKFVTNKALAERFMVAYMKGIRDYNDAFLKGKDKAAVIDIMSNYSEVKDKSIWESIKVPGLNPSGAVIKDSLVDQYNFYKAKGVVRGDVSMDKLIDLSLAEYAKKVLGEYQ